MNSCYWGEVPENPFRLCEILLYYSGAHLKRASCCPSPVVCLRKSGRAHMHAYDIAPGVYERSYLSSLLPPRCTGTVAAFSRQLSTCAGLHAVLPSLPASAWHAEKASLSPCTATTMSCLGGTLALVRRPRVPAERLPWVCLSLKSSLISCHDDKREVKVALSPPPHTTDCTFP